MKNIDFKEIEKRIISIILTAGIAALFAFLQSLSVHTGISCTPHASVATAGTIGAIIRIGVEAIG